MRINFDTDELPAPRRIRSWRGLMCETYLGLDCDAASDALRVVAEGYRVGGHSITRSTSSGHHVDRQATHIRKDGVERIYVGLSLAGRTLMTQGGREALVEPGMIAFNDSTRPFFTVIGPASDTLWLGVPKCPLFDRLSGLEDLTCVAFRPVRPIHTTALDLLKGLDEVLARLSSDAAEVFVAQALDLLATTAILSAIAPGEVGRGRNERRLH